MHVVTLITDFGNKGFRAANLKGALLSANSDLKVIDVTHEVSPFDIDEAAFILRSTYASFPSKTVHIVNVLNYYGLENRIVFFEHNNHFFIGPDNGLFSLVFEDLNSQILALAADEEHVHYTQLYARVLGGLKDGVPLGEIGVEIEDMSRKLILQPVRAKDEIRGSVIFVDRYGNVVVNIKKHVFNQVRGDRSFSLYFNRHDHIQQLSNHYMEVDIGSPLCNFNSQGYLEIAVNLQRADELLGIKKGDVIQIKFNN